MSNSKNLLPEELQELQKLCLFCNRLLMGFCGTWFARTSGCCVGAEWKGTEWLFHRGSHINCLLKNKKKQHTFLSEKEAKYKLKEWKRYIKNKRKSK